MKIRSSCIVGALSLGLSAIASAGIVNINGVAGGSTAYYEYPSDGFFRMDLVDAPPNDHLQSIHSIADPSVVYSPPGFDGFVNDKDFRIGSISYDESALVGGTGLAPITALVLGIGAQPGNPSYINYGRWTDITTIVNTFAGTVSVVDNQAVGITLTSSVTVTALGGAIVANGPFTISGSHFEGDIAGVARWYFNGELTTVPAPASAALLGLTLGAGMFRRSRR